MALKRRSTEEGHRRKFLVIIDDTPECSRALLYAARRAEHSGGALVLLYVIGPAAFQHWLGVENIMRAEAMEHAENTLGRFADLARSYGTVEPQLVIREGNRSEESSTSSNRTGHRHPGARRRYRKGRAGAAGHRPCRQDVGHLPDSDHHRPRPSRRH